MGQTAGATTAQTPPMSLSSAPSAGHPTLLTQADIRAHYETAWRQQAGAADRGGDLEYSSPVEDAILYPTYRDLLQMLGRSPDGRAVLDVGSGSGRWVRFFLQHYRPARLLGVDYASSSVALLEAWWATQTLRQAVAQINPASTDAASGMARAGVPGGAPATTVGFRQANITAPGLNLGERFDLINVANVLFHIPEPELFIQALLNLRAHLAPGGAVVTTEYLPRTTMRTPWMLVRSRYDFEAAVRSAGFAIAAMRAFSFFSNDPMGLDGPDDAGRKHFQGVRARMQHTLNTAKEPAARAFFVEMFAEIERATLAFARERLAEQDLPSQKLVVLVAR